MLMNYLKIAWRNLLKNKGFSTINILGLAIGIACCLLILLYVAHELSYDRWNPNADRIVRPTAEIKFGGHEYNLSTVGSVIGPDVGSALPEVQTWCRIRNYGSYLVKREGEGRQNIREENVLTVDSSFFEVFPLPLVEGDPLRCLTQPDAIVLSRSRAEKYFTTAQQAIGQHLLLENRERRHVTAVFEDMPVASHFRADLLIPMQGNEEVQSDPPFWGSNNNFHTYLLLRPGTDKVVFREKFTDLSEAKLAITARELLGTSMEDMAGSDQYARFHLQNLTEIHLYSDLTPELAPNGNIRYVWIFSAIAGFILIIACINFMNLSTARSANRAKEVGVRKVMGSRRSGLIGQFLSESTLVAAIAVLLALLLAQLALPWYNELADRQLAIPWEAPLFWISLVGTVGIVGILAGSYPAFFLSTFDAIKVLKGQVSGLRKGGGFRSTLVVFQFVTSASLIIATILVLMQLNFIQHAKLGFEKSQVLILDGSYILRDDVYTLKEEMLQHPAIESATISSYLPVSSNRSDRTFSKVRGMDKDNSINMQQWRVDSDYIEALGMEIIAGRNFDPTRPADSSAMILNETAASHFGTTDPIGKKIYRPETGNSAPGPEEFMEYTVIGVVKNFHWASMRESIGSLSLTMEPSQGYVAFRYQGSETESVISRLEATWKNLAPDQPFSYRFLDEAFAQMYTAERRVGEIAGIFALLAIFVSCLGLFGLASYATEQRTKEIGIRKVLGASVANIVGMLSKNFLRLVGIALLIAVPLVWYGMNRWLRDFAYRIEIEWWVFAVAGIIVIAIAFITVSFQSIRAALANPVRSLRSE